MPLALVGSLAVHLVVTAVGAWLGRTDARLPATKAPLSIEVRERAPASPPRAPVPAAAKAPAPVPRPSRRPPPAVTAPAPPAVEPPPPPVVGLDPAVTSASGDGPAFAAGNTHLGQTADRAVDATSLARAPLPNRPASRLPGAGIDLRPPRRLRETKPVYPDLLRAQGIEADVELLVSVTTEGEVAEAKVIRPSAWPELDRAAQEAARRDRYTPATRNGVPQPYALAFTTRFRLEAR